MGFLNAALYPSTRAFIRQCYNLVMNAIAASVSFAALALVVILLNLLIDYIIKDTSGMVRDLLSPIADLLPVIFVVASVITNVFDIVKLTIASLKSSDNSVSGSAN